MHTESDKHGENCLAPRYMTFTDFVLQIIVSNSYFKILIVEFKFGKFSIHLSALGKLSDFAACGVTRSSKMERLVFLYQNDHSRKDE